MKRTIRRWAITAAASAAALALGATVTTLAGDTEPVAAETPTVATYAEVGAALGAPTALDLIADHDCWTNDGPDVIPGHVVVTLPGDQHATYAGRHVTGLALAQLFDGADHGLTVHAFCR